MATESNHINIEVSSCLIEIYTIIKVEEIITRSLELSVSFNLVQRFDDKEIDIHESHQNLHDRSTFIIS